MKLLASDFDNTLLFQNKMRKTDIDAIHHFQEKGHLFGLCTGRTLEGVLRPSRPYHLHYDFYILLSGALILNKNLDVIFEKKVPIEIAKSIYEYTDQQYMSIVYNNEVYRTKNDPHFTLGHQIDSFDIFEDDEVSAFSIHFQPNEIEKATLWTKRISKMYGQWIDVHQNNEHLDIVAKGCSKGSGIHLIQDYFQLSDQQMHCIGDSWNDLPMLEVVEHSYTFTYAPENVQNQARYIVKDLAECIEMIENKK